MENGKMFLFLESHRKYNKIDINENNLMRL